jgi:hypothetical protein
MRVVITFLILLNVVLYLWAQTAPSERVVGQVAPPDVGTLRLWSEVLEANSQRDLAESQPLPPDGEASPIAAAHALAPQAEPMDRMPPADQQEILSQMVPERAAAEATEELMAVPAEEAPNSDGMESGEQPLDMAEALAAPTALEQEPDEPDLIDATASEMVCGQLRWYDAVEAAHALIERLDGLNVPAELIKDAVEQRTGYWVIIPPQPNRAAALAKRAELRAMGVEDLWLFRKGPLLNSISVGLFTGNRRAQRRAEEIRALGFEVEVRPKSNLNERYAVAYRTDRRNAELLSESLLLAASMENQRVPCP